MSIFDRQGPCVLDALKNEAIANWEAGGSFNALDRWHRCQLTVNEEGRIDGYAFEWVREDICNRKISDPIPPIYKFGNIQKYYNCYMNSTDMHILP